MPLLPVPADQGDEARLMRDIEVDAFNRAAYSVHGAGLAVLGIGLARQADRTPRNVQGLTDEQPLQQGRAQRHFRILDEHLPTDGLLLGHGDQAHGLSGTRGRPDVLAGP